MSSTNTFETNDFLQLLDFQLDDSIEIIDFEFQDSTKIIHFGKKLIPVFCPSCAARMHSKGIYKRTVKHPIFQDSTILKLIVHQRRWHCPDCNLTVNDEFSFLQPRKQSTNLTSVMVLNAMKDLNRTTKSIADQFSLSDSTVHDIFTAYVDLPRLPFPEYISIDEVCLNISHDQKYAFVIMDFVSGEIIDIVHNRWMNTLEKYFLSISLDERKKVKGIISDAYKNYLEKVPDFFPNSVSILDSFHVSRVLISSLNIFLTKLAKQFKEKDEKKWEERALQLNRDQIKGHYSQEVILLQNYKWVLLKNYDDINHSHYSNYHSKLRMHLTTNQIEDMFFKINPRLKTLHQLKELYISFNSTVFNSEEEVESSLNQLTKTYDESHETIFLNFSSFLKSHKKEIIRSFTTLQVSRKTKDETEAYYSRLSNGLMESFNRKPKDFKRATRGSSNFDYTRNRILWATRNHPTILAVPKSNDEVHSYRLRESTANKRSSNYKK